jgi:HPr kinase/phosphorylase
MNFRLKRMGVNAAKDFTEKLASVISEHENLPEDGNFGGY